MGHMLQSRDIFFRMPLTLRLYVNFQQKISSDIMTYGMSRNKLQLPQLCKVRYPNFPLTRKMKILLHRNIFQDYHLSCLKVYKISVP